jgi:hypothetical protein
MPNQGKSRKLFAICLTLAAIVISTFVGSCANVRCGTEGSGGGPGGCGFEQHFSTY